MSPGGQSNLLLIRRLLHPSTCDFDPIRVRFFAQVLPKSSSTARITMDVYAQAVTPEEEEEDTKTKEVAMLLSCLKFPCLTPD
jgi:hypothetical protein